jgi:hypothetical protein
MAVEPTKLEAQLTGQLEFPAYLGFDQCSDHQPDTFKRGTQEWPEVEHTIVEGRGEGKTAINGFAGYVTRQPWMLSEALTQILSSRLGLMSES